MKKKEKKEKDWIDKLALVFVTVGALNWGLIGVTGVNYIQKLTNNSLSQIIYIVVGISGLYIVWSAMGKK